jgi:lipopolysaccharide transport system permease protein
MSWSAPLAQRRDLLRELVTRDMKLRYKRSVLGMLWSLLNPLAQLLVFTFLFRRVVPLDIPNYPSYVFSGLIVWSWFQSSLLAAAGSISGNRELLRRPGFPVAILPVVAVTTSLIHLLLAFPVLLCFLALDRNLPGASFLAVPLLILVQYGFTLGFAYVVSALQVVFGDTQHLLGVGLLALFYLTPIFYQATDVPARYVDIYRLNPMVHFVRAFRGLMLIDRLPGEVSLVVLSALSVVCLLGGYFVFNRISRRFVEEV